MWCLDEDKIERNASQSSFQKGYLCYLPSQVLLTKQTFRNYALNMILKFKLTKGKIEKGREYARLGSIEIKLKSMIPKDTFLHCYLLETLKRILSTNHVSFRSTEELASEMPLVKSVLS